MASCEADHGADVAAMLANQVYDSAGNACFARTPTQMGYWRLPRPADGHISDAEVQRNRLFGYHGPVPEEPNPVPGAPVRPTLAEARGGSAPARGQAGPVPARRSRRATKRPVSFLEEESAEVEDKRQQFLAFKAYEAVAARKRRDQAATDYIERRTQAEIDHDQAAAERYSVAHRLQRQGQGAKRCGVNLRRCESPPSDCESPEGQERRREAYHSSPTRQWMPHPADPPTPDNHWPPYTDPLLVNPYGHARRQPCYPKKGE